jgi:hypothetical protein
MKTIVLYIILFSGIVFLFGGCKKEELPPLKCYTYTLKLLPVNTSTNPVDSVTVYLEKTDEGSSSQTKTFIPTGAVYNANSTFCGVFKYRISVYNTPSPIEQYFAFIVENFEIAGFVVTGDTTVEGHYTFRHKQ